MMKNKIKNVISAGIIFYMMCCLTFGANVTAKRTDIVEMDGRYSGISASVYNMLIDVEKEQLVEKPADVVEVAAPAPVYPMDDGEIELLAFVMVAEAEGESEYGKRLVIDTILNRMDSDKFPDTVYGVTYQPGQFSSMWNGRICRVSITEDDIRLVQEELLNRTNSQVMFFTAGRYNGCGYPMFQEGNHCFSGL